MGGDRHGGFGLHSGARPQTWLWQRKAHAASTGPRWASPDLCPCRERYVYWLRRGCDSPIKLGARYEWLNNSVVAEQERLRVGESGVPGARQACRSSEDRGNDLRRLRCRGSRLHRKGEGSCYRRDRLVGRHRRRSLSALRDQPGRHRKGLAQGIPSDAAQGRALSGAINEEPRAHKRWRHGRGPLLVSEERGSSLLDGESSKRLLGHHLSKGKLILCEVVFAGLASCFPSEEELRLFLADTGMGLVSSNEEWLYVAGMRWAECRNYR